MSRWDDERLTEKWLACGLGRAITHEEHLRIAFVLLRRHGRQGGGRQIAEGTRRNCEALDSLDRYDASLTHRWSEALADALETSDAPDADAFLLAHPQFRQSDLYGLPAWKLTER
jgi:hypothetical protein